MQILIPIVTLTGLGVLFGIGLSLAAKRFCVASDPRLEEVFKNLPGANCGACGLPGCMGFAEGLIQGKCTIERCSVMQDEVREKIAGILGVEHRLKLKRVAVLHCHGGNKRAKDKFTYNGIRDCTTANLMMGGPKACVYGCIGFGTCARVCPFGAITMSEEDLPIVNEDKCTACGKCVEICPKMLFSLVEVSKNYAVRCKSQDLGKVVMQACSVGCIACGKCAKACPVTAIKILDNLAVIDYDICENKGECFKVCPTKAIANKRGGRWQERG